MQTKKKFLNILTKIFTSLLSVKADNSEKIIKIVKLAISAVLKSWSELNQFQKELEQASGHLENRTHNLK